MKTKDVLFLNYGRFTPSGPFGVRIEAGSVVHAFIHLKAQPDETLARGFTRRAVEHHLVAAAQGDTQDFLARCENDPALIVERTGVAT